MQAVFGNPGSRIRPIYCAEYEDDMDAKGFLAIQHHGEKGQTYRFRDLRVKELKK